tara:strand:+ start:370 stop:627 length:258 start_codon:yes stop_codon:yes gene_type:complete
MRYGLTKGQRNLYDVIVSYHKKHGITPTYKEMMEATGIKSKNQIAERLSALEERGWIKRMKYLPRGIALLASHTCETCGQPINKF